MDKMAKPAILAFIFFIIISLLFLIYPKKRKKTDQFILKNLPFEAILKEVCIKGVDKNNLPWKLTAKEILAKKKFNDIYLKFPVLLKRQEDNSYILIKAETGFYNKKNGEIILKKNIEGHYKDIQIKGNLMQFYLKSNTIYFRDKIMIRDSQFILKGENAIVNLNTHLFQITGNVEVNLL